jgi:hypothetical protein
MIDRRHIHGPQHTIRNVGWTWDLQEVSPGVDGCVRRHGIYVLIFEFKKVREIRLIKLNCIQIQLHDKLDVR